MYFPFSQLTVKLYYNLRFSREHAILVAAEITKMRELSRINQRGQRSAGEASKTWTTAPGQPWPAAVNVKTRED